MADFSSDVSIILSGDDQASPVVEAAAKRINSAYKQMQNDGRAVERSTIMSHQEFFRTAQTLSSVGSAVGRVMNIYSQYNLQQIRLATDTRNLEDAQQDLRYVMLTEGTGSEAYVHALRRVRDAQIEEQNATNQSKLALVGYGIEAVGAAANIANLIPRVTALAATLGLLKTTSAVPLSGALGGLSAGGGVGLGKAGTAMGIAAGAGLAGAGIMTSQAMNPTSSVDNTQKVLSTLMTAGGGALTGAMIGSIVPVLGTAVGAAIGGGIGLAAGIATNFLGPSQPPPPSQIPNMSTQDLINQGILPPMAGYNKSANQTNVTINIQGSDPSATAAEAARQMQIVSLGQ